MVIRILTPFQRQHKLLILNPAFNFKSCFYFKSYFNFKSRFYKSEYKMSSASDLQNTSLYYKINDYYTFNYMCHVGDTYVYNGVKSVITQIEQDLILSIVINQDGTSGRDMGTIITLALTFGIPIYKYIGPTNKELQQKQDNIDHLQDFLVEARLKPLEQGCISFIGEDYREGREVFNINCRRT